MKKTLFAATIALLLQAITFLVFFLPDSVIYSVKQPSSTLHTWVVIWGYIILFIMSWCTIDYYYKLGEKLFDYLKQD